MATADEILATMSEEDAAEDNVLVIDNDLRSITIPACITNLGVESDKEVLRLHFRMPKTYGEFDLSMFELRINYMNARNEGDIYVVKDAVADGDYITFSWLVGEFAVKYKGDVKFIVCAKLLDDTGEIKKEFNTTPTKLPVLDGLETSEAVVQLHPDVIEYILLRLDELEQHGAGGGSGAPGADGGYYQPSVDSSGNLTWTASKADMPQVAGANIRGPEGKQGPAGANGEKGDTGAQGPAGADGAKGDKGDKGEPGPQGATGPQGPAGTSSTLEITGAESLPHGSAPTVTEEAGSTAQARRYKLGIPEGKPGADGKTPVKGVDYFTDADKAGIVSDVLAALPNASGVNF